MQEFWANSGLDLLVETQWSRRRSSLEGSLRHAIQSGRLAPGVRLPSSRALAQDLGWSRGTVAAAYDQLVAEGYLAARQGFGTSVVYRPTTESESRRPAWGTDWRFDLRPGPAPTGSFPVAEWLRHQREALHEASQTTFGYGDPAGSIELRTELAAYLGRVRGVRAEPANIVITAGITQALSLLAGVLASLHPGRPIAVEDPGFWFHRDVLARSGLTIVPLPVDRHGADPRGLAVVGAGAAVVTPSHQYPTGVTMTRARRAGLVAWARANDALIIEDDYDGELRFDRTPVAALQADAPDCVVYCGTASKALSPSLRLGWLVVPDALADAVTARQMATLRGLDVISQLGLAYFIAHHAYDQRVRTVRAAYRRRYRRLAELVARLARDIPGLRLGGIHAGGQAPLALPPGGPGEGEIIEAAAVEELGLEGLAASSHRAGSHPPGLLIGFSRPADHRYEETLVVLERVLRSCSRSATPNR